LETFAGRGTQQNTSSTIPSPARQYQMNTIVCRTAARAGASCIKRNISCTFAVLIIRQTTISVALSVAMAQQSVFGESTELITSL
jgi:hypothetical protein